MKLFKQILCFALAMLMLLTVVACNNDSKKGGDTTPPPAATTPPPAEQSRPTDQPPIPDNLLDGQEIVLRSRVQPVNANSFYARRDGDVVNNAVYDRNKQISDWLGCAIRVEEVSGNTNNDDMITEIQELGQACEYHIITTATYRMVRLAVEGMLHDLASQQYVDLTKGYYDSGYNAALNAGGRQYLVAGKLSLSWYRYQIATIFNRNMFKENNIEYPYELVLNQEWTIAKMAELASNFYVDIDGMGEKDEGDQFGFYLFVGSGSSQTDGFMGAWNLRVLTKDAEGYYKAREFDAAPWTDSTQAFLDMFYLDGCYKAETFEAGDGNAAVDKKFSNQETAMIVYRLYVVESDAFVSLSRDKEGYGILPLPKANEDQGDYISFVQDQVLSFGIPNSMLGTDQIAATAFLEAFSWVSYVTTVPAYYERALTKKYVIDEKSKGMLAIIDTNIIVDPVNVYYGAYFSMTTGSLRGVYAGTSDMASIITAQILDEGLQVSIDNLNNALRELDQRLTENGIANSGIIIADKDMTGRYE